MPVIINGSTGISGTDGSAATPAVQGTDANTGMFFPAADQIAFAEGGTEVMRINSSAQVEFSLGTVSLPSITATGDTNTGMFFPAADTIAFAEGGVESMRIDSSGRLLVGTTAPLTETAAFIVRGAAGVRASSIFEVQNTTGDFAQCQFINPNGVVGSIRTSGSGTSYVTSSDHRLKHDVQPLTTGLATIAALKPSTYKWNADESHGEGFIAHELAEHIPLAVTGEKDAVDAEGRIQPQGVDYSKVVVHLVAAVQELKAENDALKARIATLEAR